MAGTEGDPDAQPLFEPRVVRFLKNRPRLVDRGLRQELFEELEYNIRERRKPDNMAESVVREGLKRFEEAGGRVAKNRTKQALDKANKGPLKRL